MSRVSKPVDLSWARAVVLGLDHVNGIQTARVLARRGIPVVGVAKDPRHHLCRTRVCQRIVFADTAGEGLIDALEDLGRSLDQRAVLYPCARATLKMLGRSTESASALVTLFQSTPCRSGGCPVSIDVCDGSVLLG